MKRFALFIFFVFCIIKDGRACSCPPFNALKLLTNGAVSFSGWLISMDTVQVYERTTRSRGLAFWKNKYEVSRVAYGRARLLIDTAYYSKYQLPDTIAILWPLGGDCAIEFYPPFVADAAGMPELNHYLIFAYWTAPFVPGKRGDPLENEHETKLICTNYYRRDFCYGNLRYSAEQESGIIQAVQNWKKMNSEK